LLQATTAAFAGREVIANGEYNEYYRRREILDKIAEMGMPGAFLAPAITPALVMEHEEIVVMAAESLGNFGPAAKAAVPALEELAKNTDYPRRQAALKALRKITPADREK